MNAERAPVAIEIRRFRDDDLPAVLELLDASLGGGPAGQRPPEFFRWKHLSNPFGHSYMLLAEADGRIVGLRAFMRWRFRADGRLVDAVRAVDTATHPEYQGMGIFSRLTKQALQDLHEEVSMVFNTPNDNSLPGYLKMGWEIVGRIPVWVRPRRPLRFLRGVRGWKEGDAERQASRPPVHAELATDALDDPGVAALLEACQEEAGDRITTPRDLAYLRWRYGAAPLLDYRAVREHRNGRLDGLALFRVRPRGRLWESTVAETLVRPGDHGAARRLLRRTVAAAAVDHLTCHFGGGASIAHRSRRAGFVRAPGGITFVVRSVGEEVRPDPGDLRSWALTLGDVEVF